MPKRRLKKQRRKISRVLKKKGLRAGSLVRWNACDEDRETWSRADFGGPFQIAYLGHNGVDLRLRYKDANGNPQEVMWFVYHDEVERWKPYPIIPEEDFSLEDIHRGQAMLDV